MYVSSAGDDGSLGDESFPHSSSRLSGNDPHQLALPAQQVSYLPPSTVPCAVMAVEVSVSFMFP